MAQNEILNSIKEFLNEEKWSKFQLSEYNVKKFKQVDEIIGKIDDSQIKDAVIKVCMELLEKNEYNLIARYIIAVLSYPEDTKRFFDGFEKVINNFRERAKWGIVEYLSKRMNEIEENEFGLRTLMESFKFLNKFQDKIEIQKKISKLNPEDTSISLSIAKDYEQNKNIDESIFYYKQAIKVFITQKNAKMIEEIWLKFIDMVDSNDISIFLDMESALKANFDAEFVSNLYGLLIPDLSKKKRYDEAIKLLKMILEYSPKNKEYREKLVEIYSIKYKDHSRLEDLLKSSGLKMWWKDINSAILLFEKQIKFDVGVYVYHHSWGTGKIVEISRENITIDFPDSPEHKMSFDMALNTLQILQKEHIKVLKRYDSENIKKIADKEPLKFIEIVLNSYPNREITIDELKEEITDGVINSKDWMKWWNNTKKELKTSSNFKFIDAEKKIKYVEGEKNFGDIILGNFDKSELFDEKIKITYDLIENDIHRKVNIKIYQHIADWFIKNLNDNLKIKPEISYISLIVINKLSSACPSILKNKLKVNAEDIINSVSNITSFFKHVDIIEYQKILIHDIVKYRDDWEQILYDIMFSETSKIFEFVLDIFVQKKKTDNVDKIIKETMESYREYPELFLWIAKNILSESLKEYLQDDINKYKFKVFEVSFFMLSYIGRQIKKKSDVQNNTKLQKQIIRLLFDNSTSYFLNFIKYGNENNIDVSSLLRLFKENEHIPEKHKENIVGELRSLEKPIIA